MERRRATRPASPAQPMRSPDRLRGRRQAVPVPRLLAVVQAMALGAALPGAARAQSASGFTLTPSLTTEAEFDDVRNSPTNNGHEVVVRVSPGVHLQGNSGTVRGVLDYTGSLIERRGRADSGGGEWQNALNASFLIEAVPARAFIDARASISQQSLSAFGVQVPVGSLRENNNRSEVSTVSVSPYVQGQLGGLASYEVRLRGAATDGQSTSSSTSASDSRSTGVSANLGSISRGAKVFWGLTASRDRVRYATAGEDDRTVDTGAVAATVGYVPWPELRLRVSLGRESVDDNGASADSTDATTRSVGLQWAPSPRTTLDAEAGQRYFGHTGRATFSHRSPRTTWAYTFVRDASNGADGTTLGQPTSYYDIVSSWWPQDGYANADQRRRDIVAYLASLGVDANQSVQLGYRTTSYSVQRRQDLSVAWFGLRTTVTLQAFGSDVQNFVSFSGSDPILGEPVVQHGYTASLSYRLTPQTSLNLGGQRLMTAANSTQAGTDLKSATAGISSQIGPRTSATLSARYSVFNSTTEPYRETSVSATLGVRF